MALEDTIATALAGGVIGALVAITVAFLLVFLICLYVYFSLAWFKIAKKLNYSHPWIAWIPIIKKAMILQLGDFHWAWIFLIFIPIVGWIALFILCLIARWRVFEKRNYPGWFTLSVLIPKIGLILYGIALGFVAWKDRKGRITI